MSNDRDQKIIHLADATRGRLKSGGGSGTFDPMEARVKALEDRFEKIDGKLDRLVTDVSYLKGKVDSMPSTLHLLGFAVAVFVAAGLFRLFTP